VMVYGYNSLTLKQQEVGLINKRLKHYRQAAGGVMTEHKIRRLTETECERLQGFPDGWTEGVSSTQRYKCLGNAVTVKIVEMIARRLKE
jgi:site-specific DNA-cytosine methylase